MHTGLRGNAWTSQAPHRAKNVLRRESLAGLVERANTSRSKSSKALFLWFGCAAASAKVNEALPLCWTKIGWSLLPATATGAGGVRAAKMASSSLLLTPLASTASALATRSLGPRISRDNNTGAWCPLPVCRSAAQSAPRPTEDSIMITSDVAQHWSCVSQLASNKCVISDEAQVDGLLSKSWRVTSIM